MKRESLIFFFGFVIISMPFVGLPSMWKRVIYVILGVLLVFIGYQLRRLAYVRGVEDRTGERKTDVYVEQVEQLFVETGTGSRSRGIAKQSAGETPKSRLSQKRTKEKTKDL